jgi:hypothetical protein
MRKTRPTRRESTKKQSGFNSLSDLPGFVHASKGCEGLTERSLGVLLLDCRALVLGEEHVRGEGTLGRVGILLRLGGLLSLVGLACSGLGFLRHL